MVRVLNTKDSSFNQELNKFLLQNETSDKDVDSIVEDIIAKVKSEQDDALIEYTKKFDRHSNIKVSIDDFRNAKLECSKEVYDALIEAKERIFAYHEKQLPREFDYQDKIGVRLGNLWRPINRVGIYVPGGLASYPSSVLMNAIPAIVAGVKDIVMAVPAPDNKLNPAILLAAEILNIRNVYKIGGAQALAAFAYGTQTISRVDKIVGPGNKFVACAKKRLFGEVGIDMVAGPSEILVVADKNNNPAWVASDLLSQAEHDESARSILVTDDKLFANLVISAVNEHLAKITRAGIAKKSWDNNGLVVIVDHMEEAIDIINKIAPEHLELMVDEKIISNMIARISNAGAIFVGAYTPEAIGDYIAGPSHVLPTSGTARFSSGLSVYDFMKRISLIGCSKQAFQKLANNTKILADSEGLDAHALSVSLRKE